MCNFATIYSCFKQFFVQDRNNLEITSRRRFQHPTPSNHTWGKKRLLQISCLSTGSFHLWRMHQANLCNVRKSMHFEVVTCTLRINLQECCWQRHSTRHSGKRNEKWWLTELECSPGLHSHSHYFLLTGTKTIFSWSYQQRDQWKPLGFGADHRKDMHKDIRNPN